MVRVSSVWGVTFPLNFHLGWRASWQLAGKPASPSQRRDSKKNKGRRHLEITLKAQRQGLRNSDLMREKSHWGGRDEE